ncbi:NAD-dependent epimerase/dehydratase family protein [Microbacterium schleiferi]|uniref:NAD(P)-dependent oxidoreductase n=1 Tax=Microbacterium schleiferi TaxID=69362 RepID=A0ABU7V493_9MICO
MRVLVTGSAGRLGRSTTSVLVAHGHHVVGADVHRGGTPGVTELAADLLDRDALRALMTEVRPDAVVHLAGIAVPFSAPESDILRINSQLAHGILETARDLQVERVLCASSPTLIGYSAPGWRPSRLPLDEEHPVAPANAYAVSKVLVEELTGMFARSSSGVYGAFRPCYVITPEEWLGAPTQQGHTVRERLSDPSLAAVSLFNYLDARDAGEFIARWLLAPSATVNGEVFFVGAADALALQPVSKLAPQFAPKLGSSADALIGTQPVFSIDKARHRLGWEPRRSWRTELVDAPDPTPAQLFMENR